MREQAIRPYHYKIDPAAIDDLTKRLNMARFPDEDEAILGEKDLTIAQMISWLNYWKNDYDMKNIEKKFNAYDLYKTTIDKIDIIFNHILSEKEDAPALLLIHGWPDSPLSYFEMIDLLKNDFELIIPSIPGFGISGAETDINDESVASLYHQMMVQLGKDSYYVHGIDYGSMIGRNMAVAQPEAVKGLHVTMLFHALIYDESQMQTGAADEIKSLEASRRYEYELSGYAAIQSTKPQDLAYAMSDSPLGLLGWIGAQFLSWSPSPRIISDEQLLDAVMIYWLSNTLSSSARFYKLGSDSWGGEIKSNKVPTSVTVMQDDIGFPIRSLAEEKDQIVDWTIAESGGHFAAYDNPIKIAEDIIRLKGIVEGK